MKGRSYFTTSDWIELLRGLPPEAALLHVTGYRALTGLDEKASRQACWRLSRSGILTHVGAGWYTHTFARVEVEEAAVVLVSPSYVSLESILSRHGVTTQRQPSLTCVTLQPAQTRKTPLGEIRYQSIARSLFWGFEIRETANRMFAFEAHPEKALLDLIYQARRGSGRVWLDLDFSRLDATRLAEYAARYPAPVRRTLAELRETHVVVS